MFYRDIFKLLGTFFCGFSLTLLFPLAVCLYYEYYLPPEQHLQPHATFAFFETFVMCLALGLGLRWVGRKAIGHLYLREGLIIVVLMWFTTPFIAGLPFYLSGTLNNPLHAYFEAVSGFTTTGATVMDAKSYDPLTGNEIERQRTIPGIVDTTYRYSGTITPVRNPQTGLVLFSGVEAVNKGLLWWRSFIQWLGGVGIVVLFVAVLPALGVGGKILLFAEMPGPLKDSLTPRIKETAAMLWKIYLGLTVLQIAILRLTNDQIGWYDAFTITFSTLSTGGFTTRNANIGAFNNGYTDWVVIAFMLAGSLNFSLYFHAIRGKVYRIYEPEFFIFLCIVLFSAAFAVYELYGTQNVLLTGQSQTFDLYDAIRYGTFQTVSAQTSTGFATADYVRWPYAIQTLMLIIMFIGGMSGSTAGGIKVARPYILFHIVQTRVESMFRPEAVRLLRIGNREISTSVAITIMCYFVIVVFFTVLGIFLLTWDGLDPETALATITCMINNIGLGFRMGGPTESFAFLSNFGVVVSSLWMILGRLEFYAILVLLVPAFWRQDS
ncbi:MAG: TrkH family potassium uptake protein [Chlamydiales bacterium]|nr:TrkH family potassium uptake protein [Chlamydiales bacterium]